METQLKIKTEQLDDIPLLLAQLKKMGIADLLDSYFPSHGNWSGLSFGKVVCVWLTHIISEGDHYLDHVRSWVQSKEKSLCHLIHSELGELDFTDDRLANILSRLSHPVSWDEFEGALNQKLLRVYELEADCIRHDSTTSSSFRLIDSEKGTLFQLGHSKDHRPDLPQLKIMMATLDPFGMPLATEVLSGNSADDPLYIPSVERVQNALGKTGLLHVGDCKMSSLETRRFIVSRADHYLCPLSEKQLPKEKLLVYLEQMVEEKQSLEAIYRTDAKGETHHIAEGFECSQEYSVEGNPQSWTERHLVIRSFQHAHSAEKALRQRIEKAKNSLLELNRRARGKQRPHNRNALEEKVIEILKRDRVETFLHVQINEFSQQRTLRRYKERPAMIQNTWNFHIQVTLQDEVLQQRIEQLGWKVYATSTTKKQLSLKDAVLCYRNEYRIEHSFKRIKGSLSLRPIYLQRDDRVQGLVHLLSIALRGLSLIEFVVRKQLQTRQESLTGLYPGQPKKQTKRPTTERMLRTFKGLYLTIIEQNEGSLYHVNELSALQLHILSLLNLPPSVYYQFVGNSSKPP